MSEITCSSCGEEIHNEELKSKIKSIQKLIIKRKYDFDIVVQVYCCDCLDGMLEAYGIKAKSKKGLRNFIEYLEYCLPVELRMYLPPFWSY